MCAYSEIRTFGSVFKLGSFEIFNELNSAQRAEVSKLMRIRKYDAGSYIVSEDQNSRDVFFIISGHVRTCTNSHHGKQLYFEDLYSGMMFGEFSAIDQTGRSADCLTVTDSLIANMSGQCFLELMDRYPRIKDAVLRRIVKIVRDQMQRLSENVFFNVGQRVRFELIRLCKEAGTGDTRIHFESVPTHTEIALRIGTHREAVTRELNSLQARGLITWNRQKHVVHNYHALSSYAQM